AVPRADGLAELPGTGPDGAGAGPAGAGPAGAGPAGPAALPPPRLLGAFDPLLLGWASRDPVVGPYQQIVTVNGLFRPFALAGGRAVATWTITRGQVVLTPFTPLNAGTRA